MSNLKEDITGFLESKIDWAPFVSNRVKGTPYTIAIKSFIHLGLEALLNKEEFTGTLELLEQYNLRCDVVQTKDNDNGYNDYVLKFDRPDKREESVFVKISYNSYSGERWSFVKPKPFEGVIYE